MLTTDRRFLHFIGLRPTGDLGPLTSYTSKRRKVVWFLKAPPTKPATGHQVSIRNRFRMIARLWRSLTPAQREQWSLAEKRGRLNITSYNLFVWYQIHKRDDLLRTIERHTGTTLLQ